MNIKTIGRGFLSITFTLFIANSAMAEPSCDVDAMIQSGKEMALKATLAEGGYSVDQVAADVTEYVGGGIEFADCCWSKRTVNVKLKQNSELVAQYKLSVGNNWGEYKKGICEVSVSRLENFIPMQRPEDCQYIAGRYARTVADQLAEVSFTQMRSNQSLEYDVKKGSLHIGKLLVSPVECRFQSYQTVMEKLIP